MRASSPVEARRPVPSASDRDAAEHEPPPPQPLALADTPREPVTSTSSPDDRSRHCGTAEHGRARWSAPAAAPRRASSTIGAEAAGSTALAVASSTPSWRRSAGSNAPNVRRSSGTVVVERVAARATTPSGRRRRAARRRGRSTVPLPARKPSTNAAPTAGGVPGDSARDSRALDLGARPSGRRRAAAGSPGRAPGRGRRRRSASCVEHGRERARAGPGDRRSASAACTPAEPLDHRAPPRRRRASGRRRPAPASTRTTSPSNTDAQRRGVGAAHVAVAQRPGQRAERVHQLRRRRGRARPARRARCTTGCDRVGQVGEQRRGRATPTRSASAAAASARSSSRCVAAASTVVPWPASSISRIDQLGLPRAAATSRGTCRCCRGPPRARPTARRARAAGAAGRERRSPFGVRRSSSTVLLVGLRLQPGRALLRGQVAGQRHLRRVRRAPSPIASPTTSSSTDAGRQRRPSPCRRRRAPRPARGGAGRAARPASSASAGRGDQVVGRGRHAAAAQQRGRRRRRSGRRRRRPGWREHVGVPARAAHAGAVAGGRGAGGGASTAPSSRRPSPSATPRSVARVGRRRRQRLDVERRHVPRAADDGDRARGRRPSARRGSPGACAPRAAPRDATGRAAAAHRGHRLGDGVERRRAVAAVLDHVLPPALGVGIAGGGGERAERIDRRRARPIGSIAVVVAVGGQRCWPAGGRSPAPARRARWPSERPATPG